jgi:hypothetical protein
MGWEERRGTRYYYRKKREGGRVLSEYVGGGEIATMLTNLEQADRAERAIDREDERETRRHEEEIDDTLDAVTGMAATLTAATLLVAGCHTHRGQWRRRRGQG